MSKLQKKQGVISGALSQVRRKFQNLFPRAGQTDVFFKEQRRTRKVKMKKTKQQFRSFRQPKLLAEKR